MQAAYARDVRGQSCLGLELERFIVGQSGELVSAAAKLLAHLGDDLYSSAEPSACQLEAKTPPCATAEQAIAALMQQLARQDAVAEAEELQLIAAPYRPDVPDAIFPTQAYQQLASMLRSRGDLHAALAVTSFQVNLSFSSLEAAFLGYNRLVAKTSELLRMGDFSAGRRQALYQAAVPHHMPLHFDTVAALGEEMLRRGVSDPAKLHTWVVMKLPGIVEVRCFDATDDPAEMSRLIRLVQEIANHPS